MATDTPAAVTVLEQDDIDEQIPDSAAALASKIPGLNAAGNASNPIGQNFNIRGFGPESVGSSQEGRVQVNVDGATKYYESYRMGGFLSDLDLYKRVEVLRGPAAGTLYGSGVLGGVINFTTKDASDFLEDGDTGALKIKMTGDSNQKGYKASAILALRMGDSAEFLASANYTDFKNIITSDGRERLGTSITAPSFLAKGTFYLNPEKERIVRIAYSQTTSDGLSTNTPGGAPTDTNPFNPKLIPRQTFDKTATISYEDKASDNPWLDLKANFSWSQTRNVQTDPGFISADFSYDYYDGKLENTFETIGDNYKNFLTIGASGRYHERRRDNFLSGRASSNHAEYDQRAFGIYAQNEFTWNEKLSVIGGVRVDWQELSPSGTLTTAQPAYSGVSDVAFAPKLAVLYDITDDFFVFGSYAYTERMPSGDEEFDHFGPIIADGQNFLDKERANSFEMWLWARYRRHFPFGRQTLV
ncbi:MAG: TonB-dependent receptor [Ahrensia sp.]|nr:TonB-dependent receptor [Ahrensia sp.]